MIIHLTETVKKKPV